MDSRRRPGWARPRPPFFPNLSGSGAGRAQGTSEKNAPNTVPFDQKAACPCSTTQYQGELNAAWELDLWGKYRNQRTMLSDVLMNSVIGHEALRLEIAGQTAQAYFAPLALDMQQFETARRTLKSREESFGIYTSRYTRKATSPNLTGSEPARKSRIASRPGACIHPPLRLTRPNPRLPCCWAAPQEI